ncbi:MAG: tyrosine--tRNA ligase [bacterium]
MDAKGRGASPGDALASIMAAASEAVTPDELAKVVARAAAGEKPRAYIGFEPSGTAHVGWMVCTDMVRRLVDAGFDVRILLADWHAQINDKLGGDMAAIQRCGAYMQECFEALGAGKVTYVYANELARDPSYWAMVVQVQKHTSLARMRRAMTIMGRAEDEADGDMSKFLYPAMQVADIFHMGIDLAYGGLDQRHAHMLARDVAPKLGRMPPVAIHTPLVPSLKGTGRMEVGGPAPEETELFARWITDGKARGLDDRAALQDANRRLNEHRLLTKKMSKSDPGSGIFLHDTQDEIKAKLKAAHCPAKETDGNPVIDLLRLVVWPRLGQLHRDGPLRFEIHRPEKFGGNKLYVGYDALVAEYKSGALHPMDLKNGVADALFALLEPVRAHFKAHPENLAFVQGLKRTR